MDCIPSKIKKYLPKSLEYPGLYIKVTQNMLIIYTTKLILAEIYPRDSK
ncbi:hypothetical protein HMPREF0534_0712 [Limosilactobacillus reuteri CF48-3A]|uniref:Uncharacterized protein n=1 Tax=Limosilactobacillus reuteri CF48-3A TaxID=525341 RepID=A0A8D9VU67_LIMRT|nr:hypothetical protein HMPREF0534_0712 [Limosilactobacillus reuteri CF48-3A]